MVSDYSTAARGLSSIRKTLGTRIERGYLSGY